MSEDYYASLSDAQLRDILKERNIKCGPITQSTRGLYVNKLVRYDEGTLLDSSSGNTSSLRRKKNNQQTTSKLLSSGVNSPAASSRSTQPHHSTPVTSVTPPIRRSYIQYNNSKCNSRYNNDNNVNQSDPNIVEFSPYSNYATNVRLDGTLDRATVAGGSPGHTPYVGAAKVRNTHTAMARRFIQLNNGGSDEEITHRPSGIPVSAQTDFSGNTNYQRIKTRSYSPTSQPSSDNTSDDSVVRKYRRAPAISSSSRYRHSSVQTDQSAINTTIQVTEPSRLTATFSAGFMNRFSLRSIFHYGLFFLFMYLISYWWMLYSVNKPIKQNNLEKCIVTTLQDKKPYGDCNSVNNYLKSINKGDNALSISFLYSQCQHFLPRDHRLMEGFVLMLKDITHGNALVCYDHTLKIVDCSDNIFYVAAIPQLLRRIQCGFGLFVNAENLMTLLGAVGLASFVIYIRSRKLICKSECCISLEKSALFILKQQRDMFNKGFVEVSYLPIPLIRDSLIPPQNRSKLNIYWREVENQINQKPSIVCLTNQISGVPTKCWQMLAEYSEVNRLNELTITPTKRWYPSVKDVKNDHNSVLIPNQISSAPTCFLKIFNAHVAEQEIIPKWYNLVADAIIERCNYAGAIVIHCKVDATSIEGVMYVRTIDENSAIIVYNTLNNMWLSGNQLTCKFLQKDQYLRKFPESANSYGIIKKNSLLPTSLH